MTHIFTEYNPPPPPTHYAFPFESFEKMKKLIVALDESNKVVPYEIHKMFWELKQTFEYNGFPITMEKSNHAPKI